MRNKAGALFLLLTGTTLFAGCSTSPRRERPPVIQPVVQTQPAGPSAEEMRLREQLAQEQAARERAEADRLALEQQLSDALASQKTAPKKSEDNDLK